MVGWYCLLHDVGASSFDVVRNEWNWPCQIGGAKNKREFQEAFAGAPTCLNSLRVHFWMQWRLWCDAVFGQERLLPDQESSGKLMTVLAVAEEL